MGSISRYCKMFGPFADGTTGVAAGIYYSTETFFCHVYLRRIFC